LKLDRFFLFKEKIQERSIQTPKEEGIPLGERKKMFDKCPI